MSSNLSHTFITLFWKISWQAAILAGITWTICRFARKAPARWRHALWLLVLIKFFIPPFAYFPSQLSFWQKAEHNAVQSASSAQKVLATAPKADALKPVSSAPVSVHTAPSSSIPSKDPIDAVVLVWVLGLCGSLALVTIRLRRQTVLVLQSVPADAVLMGMLKRSAERLGVRRLPEMRLSDSTGTPMLIGLMRNVIVLPSSIISSCSESELEAMLLHELAHVKRHDMVVVWLYQLALMLFWFHPALWLAGREMKRERELACDELVLARSGIARRDYAAGYVSALKMANAAARVPVSLAMAEPFEMEKKRLEGILHRPISKLTLGWVVALFIACVMGFPTFAGCAQPLVKGRHNIKSGFVLNYVKPLELSTHGIKLRITGIGRSSKYNPKTGKDDLVLRVAIHKQNPRSESECGVDMSSFKLKLDSGKTLAEHKYDFPACDHIYFPLPPKGTRRIKELVGVAGCPASWVQHKHEPVNLDTAMDAMEVQKGTIAIAVADWSIGDPREYHFLLRPYATVNQPYGTVDYLNILMYMVSSSTKDFANPPTLSESEIIVYGLNGQQVEMVSPKAAIEQLKGFNPLVPDASELYYGFEPEPVPPGVPENALRLGWVEPRGPAYHAGIRDGDILVELNGKRIKTMEDYVSALSTKTNSITVLRKGKRLSTTVTPVVDTTMISSRPDAKERWQTLMARTKSYNEPMLGRYRFMSVKPIPPGFTPTKIGFTYSTQSKGKDFSFSVNDIPIPKELWK